MSENSTLPTPRLGIMLAGGGGMTVADMAELGARAEDAGFSGVYVAEAWRSGFVPVAAIAARTRRVTVGPYVLNAHARTPMIAGISAVDLDELAGGRLLLGVGSGNRVTNEKYQGVPVERPLRKMREYVELLRRVTTARQGEQVDYSGEVHSMTGWRSQVDPYRPSIPIYLAATSPRMTELAAEVADGIALGSLLSVEFVRGIADAARATAHPRTLGVMMAAMVAVDDDRERARSAGRTAVVNLYAGKPHPHYDSLLRQQGFVQVADDLTRLVAAGDLAAAHDAVPDEVVDELLVAGTPEDCARRLTAYSGIVDEVVVVNASGMRYRADGDASGSARTDLLASFDSTFALAGRVAAAGDVPVRSA
jgi:alkanesulfonate monooxygenase SsuD/methylene tetrahydromethanopterin reductase-like flavin-dependent oxidoreductase (luciferase family)